MRFYLRTDDLPELAGLTKSQGDFVYRQGIHPLLRRWPVIAMDYILLFFLLMTGADWVYPRATPGFSWGRMVMLTSAILALGHLHAMIWISLERPAIRRFISEHQAEINALP